MSNKKERDRYGRFIAVKPPPKIIRVYTSSDSDSDNDIIIKKTTTTKRKASRKRGTMQSTGMSGNLKRVEASEPIVVGKGADVPQKSIFLITVLGFIAILCGITVCALNYVHYKDSVEFEFFPYYDKLGQIGSTLSLLFIFTLFVLGMSLNFHSSLSFVFGTISIVAFGVVLSTVLVPEWFKNSKEQLFEAFMYIACISSLIAVLTAGSLVGRAMMAPFFFITAFVIVRFHDLFELPKITIII